MARFIFQGSSQKRLGGGRPPLRLGVGPSHALKIKLKPALVEFFEIVSDGVKERRFQFGDLPSHGKMSTLIFKPNNPLMGRGDQPNPGHGSTLLTSQGHPGNVYRSHHPDTGGDDRISLPTVNDRWPAPPRRRSEAGGDGPVHQRPHPAEEGRGDAQG